MVYVGARRVIDADSHLMETHGVPPRPRRRRASAIGCRTSPAAGCGSTSMRRRTPPSSVPSSPPSATSSSAGPQVARRPRRRRRRRALPGARPPRLRAPGRLLVAVRAAVRHRRRRRALRRLPGPQPGDGRLLRRRRAPARRGHRRPRRPDEVAGRARRRPGARAARGLDPGSRSRRAGAGPSRPRPVLGPPGRARRAVRAPRRQRAAADRRRVDGRRSPAGRADVGRRGDRLEGLHGRVPAGRAVPVGARARRRARAPPRRCGAGSSRWAPAGCRRCCAASTMPCRSGSAPSRGWPSSTACRPSRPRPSCASRRTRSRTSAGSAAESDPSLYLFSSDYPHAEGGRDPLGRFDRSLAASQPDRRDRRLLPDNARSWLGLSS